MSDLRNDIWKETFYERLEDECFKLNGNSTHGRYNADFIIDFIRNHEKMDLTDLMGFGFSSMVSDAVDHVISKFNTWRMEEQNVGEVYR